MKKISILLSLVVALVSCTGNSQNQLKRYNLKSGIVKYKTIISGKMMGGTITGSGTENLYFKNWGATELKEEESTQTSHIKFFGKEKTKSTSKHAMNKLDNGESYSVDFENKTIKVGRDMAMDMFKETNTSASDGGKSMLESMGGEKIGDETYQGYKCEVWTIMNGKQWIYKGVMLKMEMTVLGIKTVTEATSVKFDVSVADTNFKLPDFPLQKTESYMSNEEYQKGMDEGMENIQNMSFEEWKKMSTKNDPEMEEMSDEELYQTYDMIQKMIKMRKEN
jgi:hypothetical protein